MAEVLSPARNLSSIEAALRCGADAVYLGATEFSARRNAENFSEEEMAEAIKYCHIRGVKVYLALNTMIKQSEIKRAFETAKKAYLLGIDAIIISDLGLAALIKKAMPEIELHASTQMNIHSHLGLEALKELGFKRVVAAREMSKENLRVFCKKARELGLETEVFVHGALCMSVSGQCLLSSVLGARSGNRGLCAGPCRLPFKAEKGSGYDLSLKDLSLLNHINELEGMGVTSLKIEGRMKRPEYIAASTYAFRTATDNGFCDEEILSLLENVFSRSGFTDGYFENKINADMFGIRTEENAESSRAAFSKIHELYRRERQNVKISFSFTALKGSEIILSVTDGKNEATVLGDIPDTAIKKEINTDFVLSLLKKTGNTPYFVEDISINLDGGLFITSAQINALKNKALEDLSELRSKASKRKIVEIDFKAFENKSHKNELYARFTRNDTIPESLKKLTGIILPCEEEIPKNIPSGIKLIAEMPRWVEKETKGLKAKGFTHALCGSLASIEAAQKEGLKIIGFFTLNALNSFTLEVLENLGCEEIILSAETRASDIENIKSSLKKGVFAYGRLPLMLLKSCPVKKSIGCEKCDKKGFLTDRFNTVFPIMCRQGVAELLNSRPNYIADRLEDFSSADIKLLYFTTETKTEIQSIIEDYISGKEAEDFTRGLYYKNLK